MEVRSSRAEFYGDATNENNIKYIKYPTQPEKRKKAINDAGPHADELSLLRANKMFDVEKTVNTNMR